MTTVLCLLSASCADNPPATDARSTDAVTAGDDDRATTTSRRLDEAGQAETSSPLPADPTQGAAGPEPLVVVPSSSSAPESAASPDDQGEANTNSTVSAPSTAEPAPSSATSSPATTESSATSPSAAGSIGTGSSWGSEETVGLRFESRVADVTVDEFRSEAMAILTDQRGWGRAGFTFVADPDGPYTVVLAEGPDVDQLCLPLKTFGTVSCQNGPVVALNADRWRVAVDHWVLGTEVYRGYLVNHEVGHLLGQRHPKPRCPVAGRPAGVMEQQTAGLEGCVGNPWPREWEIRYAGQRPVVYAPLPDWGPDPVPSNGENG